MPAVKKKRRKQAPLVHIRSFKLPGSKLDLVQTTITDRLRLEASNVLKLEAPENRKRSSLQDSVFDDGHCVIWSINLKGAEKRLTQILAQTLTRDRPPNIVAIQDPPLRLPFKNCGNYIQCWRTANGVDLTSDDDTRAPTYKPPYKAQRLLPRNEAEEKPLTKVAFLIHKSLRQYRIVEAEGKNSGILATLFLETAEETVAVHNLYNHKDSVDIEDLLNGCLDRSLAHVMVGDFNLHHELWMGKTSTKTSAKTESKTEPKARLLVSETQSLGMKCLNRPGVITYSRGEDVSGKFTSVVDLTFVSSNIFDRAEHEVLKKVAGFASDHRVSELNLDLKVERYASTRYVWRLTPRQEYGELVQELLAETGLDKPDEESEVPELLECFVTKVLAPAVAELVPIVRMFDPKPTARAFISNKAVRTQRFRKAMVVLASGRRGIFHLSKRAASWSEPKRLAQTPDLVYQSKQFSTDAEKVDCFVNSIWTETRKKGPPLRSKPNFTSLQRAISTPKQTSSEQLPSTPASASTSASASIPASAPPQQPASLPRPRVSLPDFSRARIQHASPDFLQEGEVEEILKRLPNGKACGVDGVSYEALKMCRKVITPFLEHIFNKCLRLRLHPDHFKDTITFVIKKAGKKATIPNSYRPIALLNTIGKIFERLIADRLKAVALEHSLLPATQFGAPGRSTTLALESLTSTVQSGWMCDKRVSILGLDLSGAYDHVDREKLLENLMSRGIQDWLVQLIWSFLSDRRSFIHMPGIEGDEFWIDVGIPQGSPLSPLLFLFYAAPILENFVGRHRYGQVAMFSYVDDTYVVVTSRHYSTNCEIMTNLHENLYEWAKRNNLHFSPAKYKVMHFVKNAKNENDNQCKLIPEIPGFHIATEDDMDEILPDTMTILGVVVDKSLTWEAHVKYVTKRIRRVLASFKRFSGPTWGPNLMHHLRLYYGKVLAKVAYGAAAWYCHVPTVPLSDCPSLQLKYVISQKALDNLQSLQIECVLAISGARKGTSCHVQESEVHILPLLYKLHEIAMRHRCNNSGTPEYARIRQRILSKDAFQPRRSDAKSEAFLKEHHPHLVLQLLAEAELKTLREKECSRHGLDALEKKWKVPKKRRALIKNFQETRSLFCANRRWELMQYERAAKGRHFHTAHRGAYDDHCLQYYYGLTRAQSSMLLMMRTGVIGLKSNWSYRHAEGLADLQCRHCNKNIETAEHLLCHCTALERERHDLIAASKHNSFTAYMTTDSELATAWAIRYFGLKQFDGVKGHDLYQFPRTGTRFYRAELDP